MNQDACHAFLSDPESEPDHLDMCPTCRARAGELESLDSRLGAEAAIETTGDISAEVMEDLPLAPWEGASHRAWVLVFGSAGVVVLITATLFSMLGMSPVEGFLSAISQTALPKMSLIDVSQSLVALLQQAPTKFHLLLGLSFVIVNIVFFFLLKRQPRGYDASSR